MSQTAQPPSSPAARLRLAVDLPEEPGSRSIASSHVASQCDAIAELFMGGGCLAPEGLPAPSEGVASSRLGPVARPTPRPTIADSMSAKPAPIEALVLGHLPVLASAWVGQYARSQVNASGQPVALVRFRAGSVGVELFGDVHPGRNEASADLAGGITRASGRASRWLLSVDATGEPMLPGLLRSGALASLTLLTGADEAATVACYRTLKALMATDEDQEAPTGKVRIAVMGASESDAHVAGERLARAAEAFLGFRPEVVHAGSKIEPAPSSLIYRAPTEAGVDNVIGLIKTTRAPALARPAALAPPTPPQAEIPVGVPAAQATARPGMDSPVDTAALIQGVRALEVRCPYARDVRFAADADGVLHAMAVDGAEGPSAVASLAAAAAWATVNAEMLAIACPGVRPAGEAPVIQHLLTRDAKRVRGLLDGAIKVHLLVSAGPALVAGELN